MILLDTHVLVWWRAGGDRLSKAAARAIASADAVAISPVSLWEVGMLITKGRLTMDRDLHQWASDLFTDEQVVEAPLTSQAAVNAGLLSEAGHKGDPADAMLYCTAIDMGIPLISKDGRLRAFAREDRRAKVVW